MLILIIIFGALLRLISLYNAGSFWFDETFTLYFAKLPWSEAWQYLQFENNPPLHFFLARIFFILLGHNEFLLRLLSVVMSVGTIPIVYLLGKKAHSYIVGLIAAAFFAISGLSIFNAIEFRMYPLLMFLSAVSLLYFLKYLEKNKIKHLAIITFINALLVLTHITGTMVVLIEIIYFFLKFKKSRWKFVLWQIIPGVALMTWALPSFATRVLMDIPNAWYFGEIFDPLFFLKQFYAFLIFPTINNFPGWLTVVIGLGLLIVAIRSLGGFKKDTRLVFEPSNIHFVDLLFLLALAPVLIGSVLNVQIPKQYSISLVPFLLLLSVGIVELIKDKRLRIIIVVCIIGAFTALNYPAILRKPYALDKLVQAIEKESVPQTEILAAAHIYTLPLELYYHGGMPVKPIYFGEDQAIDKMRLVRHNWHINYYSKEQLDHFLAIETKLYTTILVVGTTHWQKEGDIVRLWFMNHGWRLARTYSWEGYFNPDLYVFKKIAK